MIHQSTLKSSQVTRKLVEKATSVTVQLDSTNDVNMSCMCTTNWLCEACFLRALHLPSLYSDLFRWLNNNTYVSSTSLVEKCNLLRNTYERKNTLSLTVTLVTKTYLWRWFPAANKHLISCSWSFHGQWGPKWSSSPEPLDGEGQGQGLWSRQSPGRKISETEYSQDRESEIITPF